MHSIIRRVLKMRILVLTIIIAATLLSVTLLPRLRFNSEYINLLEPEPSHKMLREEVLGTTFDSPASLYCLFEGPNVFTAEALNSLQAVLDELAQMEELKSILSPLSFMTVEKRGSRLVSLNLSPVQEGQPFDEESASLFKERLLSDDIAKGLLSTNEGDAILFEITLAEKRNDQEQIHQRIETILSPLKAYGAVSLVGTPLFEDRVLYYISHDLHWLLILCLLVIVLIFFLAFKAKRAVFIPLTLSLVALLWTLAIMALLDYELTVVNVIVPSMVIILGSSYSVHVLAEYYKDIEELDRNEHIISAVGKISKTIFGASLTTIVGFLSLLICKMEVFRELGVAVSIGILFCALLSITYIPSLLSLLPAVRGKKSKSFTHSPLSRLMHRISLIVVRRWALFLVVLAVIFVSFLATRQHVKIDTDYLTYFPKEDELISRSIDFAQKIGGTDPHYITLTATGSEDNYFLQPEVLQRVHAFETQLINANPDITHLFSFSQYTAFLHKVHQNEQSIPETPGLILMLSRMLKLTSSRMDHPLLSSLISSDGRRITISIRSYDSRHKSWESLESVRHLQRSIEQYRSLLPDDLEIEDWGIGVDALRMSERIKEDQDRSLVLSLVLVFLLVCFQFRSIRMGLFAIIPTLTGIMGNYLLMAIFSIPFDVVTVIFASITVGIGVDAAIHFLLRYKRIQREHPNQRYAPIIAQTLEETGRPIVLSSSSLILGLLVLVFASFLPVTYFGILLAFALLITTFSTLCILPSLMIAVDRLHNRMVKLLSSKVQS